MFFLGYPLSGITYRYNFINMKHLFLFGITDLSSLWTDSSGLPKPQVWSNMSSVTLMQTDDRNLLEPAMRDAVNRKNKDKSVCWNAVVYCAQQCGKTCITKPLTKCTFSEHMESTPTISPSSLQSGMYYIMLCVIVLCMWWYAYRLSFLAATVSGHFV